MNKKANTIASYKFQGTLLLLYYVTFLRKTYSNVTLQGNTLTNSSCRYRLKWYLAIKMQFNATVNTIHSAHVLILFVKYRVSLEKISAICL